MLAADQKKPCNAETLTTVSSAGFTILTDDRPDGARHRADDHCEPRDLIQNTQIRTAAAHAIRLQLARAEALRRNTTVRFHQTISPPPACCQLTAPPVEALPTRLAPASRRPTPPRRRSSRRRPVSAANAVITAIYGSEVTFNGLAGWSAPD
jgi:hypothetical protein